MNYDPCELKDIQLTSPTGEVISLLNGTIVIGNPEKQELTVQNKNKKVGTRGKLELVFIFMYITAVVCTYLFVVPSFIERNRKEDADNSGLMFFAYFALPILGNALMLGIVYVCVSMCRLCREIK